MNMKPVSRKYHWPNVIFFIVTPLIGITGTAWLVAQGKSHLATWIFATFLFMATGFSITGGYHRLFAHRTYRGTWPVRLLYILFGSAAFQGSVRWWAMEHRHHHRYEDTQADPYGINKGFWFAHIGWLFTRQKSDEVYDNVRDLDQDPMIRLQNRYYLPSALVMGFIFPTLVASLWGDMLGGLFIAGFLRMVLMHHATFCINSVCHFLGKQTYSDRHSARDSWISALFTWGEGYHNFHHTFQNDYRNGIRAWQFDPTKWLIQFLEKVRLAKNLHRVSGLRILQARLQMDQKRYLERIQTVSPSVCEKAQALLAGAREQLQQAHVRFLELKGEYQRIRQEKVDQMTVRLDDLRFEVKKARQNFKEALIHWRTLVKGPLTITERG